jgi:hypothetical protein
MAASISFFILSFVAAIEAFPGYSAIKPRIHNGLALTPPMG